MASRPERIIGSGRRGRPVREREPVLRPSRWPPRPRRATLVRATLVTLLLTLAFGVLHMSPADDSHPARDNPAPAQPAGADHTDDRNGPGRNGHEPGQETTVPDENGLGSGENGAGSGESSPGSGENAPGSGPNRPGTGANSSATGEHRPGRLPVPAGTVGVPISLAEPAVLAIVGPGARVDLLAMPGVGAGTASPSLLASGALVLDVIRPGTDWPPAVYLALEPDQATRAVGMSAGTRFAIVVRPDQ